MTAPTEANMTSNTGSSSWRQLNVTCDDWRTAERAAATTFGPLASRAQDEGGLSSWWFIRKGETWRVRFESPADGFAEHARACLLRVDGVRAVTETIYEPETTAFGGPAAMDVAHRLFHADSRCLLAQISRSGRELHRELPVVLTSRMLRAARLDWYEQGDCWARLAAHRDDGHHAVPSQEMVGAVRTLLTATADAPASPLHARPGWGSAFEDAGRQLAALSSQAALARGLRAVLAHHLLFLFNRHGVSAADQYVLASAARQAVFGVPDGQHADTRRNPANPAVATATVDPVPTTASISSEDRAAHLRGTLADYIKSWGTFRTPQVEAAFRTVPRHLFLPGVGLEEAYGRDPVVTRRAPDGTSLSSASSPKLVATMLEQLAIEPGQRVLEIGAATGFNAALLAELTGPAGTVVTIELDDDLAAQAAANLGRAGYPDVHVVCGDGAFGHPGQAPYDRIIITAEAWDIAPALWDQLTLDGLIVVPVRLHGSGLTRAIGFRRRGPHTMASNSASVCGFVPLRGISEHAGRRIQLASDAVLKVDAADVPDAPALARSLGYPAAEHWTGIPVRHDEPAEHLDLWLATATTDASFSRLTVTQRARDRGLADPARRWAGAGLYHGGTIAYVVARPIDEQTIELGVTVHGPGSAKLAPAALSLLQEWHRQRPTQPSISARRNTASPGIPPSTGAPSGVIRLPRPTTTFTIAW
jgi:protein-L-isoaspartate(D-aspartate) O-methyltransferase